MRQKKLPSGSGHKVFPRRRRPSAASVFYCEAGRSGFLHGEPAAAGIVRDRSSEPGKKNRNEVIPFFRAQNKEEYSSAVFSNGLTTTNTLPQKTPSNGLSSSLSGSPLSFLFTFVLIVLWCPLRSCCTISAFSKSKSRFPERLPFETYLSTSSSTIWSVRWSEKGLFHPCSHPALFRFPIPIMSGFYSSGAFNDLWLDPSKYPKLWFITSHYVLNCGKYSIVTVWKKCLIASGGVCTFLSLLNRLSVSVRRSGINVG